MLSSVVNRLREKANSVKTTVRGNQDLDNRKRKREQDSQDDDCIITDVIVTPPVKRQKALNRDGKKTFVRTVSEFFSAMSKITWRDKYFWKSVPPLVDGQSENAALQVDLKEAENQMERYTKDTGNQRNKNHNHNRPTQESSISYSHTVNVSDRVFKTPAHRLAPEAIVIEDDDDCKPNEPTYTLAKRSVYSVEKRNLPKARPSSLEKTPSVLSSHHSTSTDSKNREARATFNYSPQHQSWRRRTNLEGSTRSDRGSSILATDEIIRIEERNKYQDLLARVTGCEFPEPPAISESRLLKSFQQSMRKDSSVLQEKNTQIRLNKPSSLLSSGSSLLPEPSPLRFSSAQLCSSNAIKIIPSPSKSPFDKQASSHRPSMPPDKQSAPKEFVDLTSSPDNTTGNQSRSAEVQSIAKVLDGDWTKKWREAIDPVTLERERRIRQEERKRQALKEQKEKETQELQQQFEQQTSEDVEEDSFPALTDEMEAKVDAAFSAGSPATPLVEGFNVTITKGDIATLKDTTWLNDEVINFYLNMIVERSKQPDYPTVHAFNTFFYSTLANQGYTRVKRWTKKVDIFSMDLLVAPVHLEYHWCLAVIDFRVKCIYYFDSLRGKNPQCLSALRRYLQEESKDKKKRPFDLSGWTDKSPQDVPQQLNGCDCGVFACKYAEYISRGAPFNFSQEHMPYFRRRMVWEILSKKLM